MRSSVRQCCHTIAVTCVCAAAHAAPPAFTYQGALTDASGDPANGTFSMTFAMYATKTGGSPAWTQTLANVQVEDGVFTVVLAGSAAPLPAGLVGCNFLEVAVGGTPMLPRQRVTSVPFALEAADCDRLVGQPGAFYRDASNLNAGTIPEGRLPQDAIDSTEIQDASILRRDIANGAINASKLAGSSVTTVKIYNGAVTGEKIAPDALGPDQIGPDAIGASELADDAVDEAALQNGAVTADKLGDDAVDTGAIQDEAVTGPKIATNATAERSTAGWVFRAKNTNPGTSVSRGLVGETAGTSGTFSLAAGVVGQTDGGGASCGVFGETSGGNSSCAVMGYAPADTGDTKGVYGWCDSETGMGVYGRASRPTGDTLGVFGKSESTSGTGVRGHASATTGSTRRVHAWVKSPDGHAVHAYSEDANGYGIYVEQGKSYFAGYATFAGGYGDLAENYRARDGVEAGDVVVIGQGGRLEKCSRERDTAVAGIVSTQPSMKLQGRIDDSEGVVPLALVGRVLCKVDATDRPIKAGDLLTTSTTPGHAMKARSARSAAGAIIGKALEDLESGTGRIQVLVTLR